MKLGICVPWMGGTAKWRLASMQRTQKYWRAQGLDVYIGVDATRSGARNDAIGRARRAGADVVLLVDSDTELPVRQVELAAEWAVSSGRPAFPFDRFMKAREITTKKVLSAGLDDARSALDVDEALLYARELCLPCSGALVLPVQALDVVGGYDERYTVWGCEDRSFLIAMETLIGPAVRMPGQALHWWHPAANRSEMNRRPFDRQRLLASRYREAAGYEDVGYPAKPWPKLGPNSSPTRPPDPEAMRALLLEPGGPLAHSSDIHE